VYFTELFNLSPWYRAGSGILHRTLSGVSA
jgi:hypothetical protein